MEKTMIIIRRYTPADSEEWDAFVRKAKNGSFLNERNYMDYHSDRFHDHSLMAFSDDKLIALLPANEREETLYSHQGLTFGGWITDTRMTAAMMLDVFEKMNVYLHDNGFTKLIYKALPHIYHRYPAEEDLYAIFRNANYRIIGRDIATTVMREHPLKWAKGRHCGINKAKKAGVEIEMTDDFSDFWKVLEHNLKVTYNAKPVHTLDEIHLLKSRFPREIQLCQARRNGNVVAGILLYNYGHLIRTQYISANEEGKEHSAIDLIVDYLFNSDVFPAEQYPVFDFGKSTEDMGKVLNEKLIFQKEGFGGRGVCYDTYEIRVDG